MTTMNLESLAERLPDAARDLKLNLGNVLGELEPHAALGHRGGLGLRAPNATCATPSWPEPAPRGWPTLPWRTPAPPRPSWG